MKILYLSCHSILEYDELKLFEELGHDYFSIGAYINPQRPHDTKRPALKGKYHEHLASVTQVHGQRNLHPEQIEWADIIIIMHVPEWVELNWDNIKHKRVVWRSIGQSTQRTEDRLRPYVEQGLEIVRYSPKEALTPGFAGEAAMIRFYKDPEEFGNYVGDDREAFTLCQSMRSRGTFCNFDTWEKVAAHVPELKLYGPNNDDVPQNGGMLEYDDLINKYRHNRVYFYTGTHPANYTLNFMEAWMSGIPIVSVGPALGNPYSSGFNQETFEVPELLGEGLYGLSSDDPETLAGYIKELLDNPEQAKALGMAGRQRAIDVFGKDAIKNEWRKFL
jgi:hypothetical protein